MNAQVETIIGILNNPSYAVLFFALMAWSLAWKGVALWKSAKNSQRNWFVAMLLINTFGILEIIYIFYFLAKEGKKANK